MIQQLDSTQLWDICIIGGGATGLSAALDAATRGYKTLLVEQADFAKGTSSRSTKLVHGGVRYLQQGNIRLVMEALKERGLLMQNAPHLVHNQRFVVPNYKWWEKPFYGIGLKIYDRMAGRLGLGPSRFLSKEDTLQLAPTLDPAALRGGVLYHDGQFDDARLAISIAQTAAANGAVLVNYCRVKALLKKNNAVCGIWVQEAESGKEYEVQSRVVINATGVFADTIMQMDDPVHEAIVTPSQGIHLVVDAAFLPGDTAIMIPRTDDGRVLFAVPWHGSVVLGTTDTAVHTITEEPVPLTAEIDFVLQHIGRYLAKDPQKQDVKSMFAGLRPLVKAGSRSTAALSRDHLITVSETGLISITGGKWTTCRKMAEDVIDTAEKTAGFAHRPVQTKQLRLAGHDQPAPVVKIDTGAETELAQQVAKAVQEEMCITVEDFLSRRTRQLLLDARKAAALAPLVATAIANKRQKNQEWIDTQINQFSKLASQYSINQNQPI